MSPTFTIFQDPPCASDSPACASSSKTLTTPLSSTRSFGRPTSNSTSLFALDADKENIDPKTGLPRTTTTKPKNKKSLSSKNKDNSSKVLTKASKASRGSATSGPAKSGKVVRTSPYPEPAVPSFLTELSFGSPVSVQPPTPCLITGLGASGLSDFAEPDFDIQSDFVQQPSPTRSAPIAGANPFWSFPPPPHTLEAEGDRKARDLTELPLADLSEAFATDTSTSAKKSTYQNKATASGESLLSFLGEDTRRLPPVFQATPRLELHHHLMAEFDSDVSVY